MVKIITTDDRVLAETQAHLGQTLPTKGDTCLFGGKVYIVENREFDLVDGNCVITLKEV